MSGQYILVVDDNEDLRNTLADVLELAGYRVRTAENGRTGLQLASEDPPALILLDLMMPVMSGWEMYDAMMQDPELRSVPVVVISAAPEPRLPGVLHFSKPIEISNLLEAVRRHARFVSIATKRLP